jgi:hypothetical protein
MLRASKSGLLSGNDGDVGGDIFDSLPKKDRKTFKTLIRISTLLLSELLDEVIYYVLYLYFYLYLYLYLYLYYLDS